MNNSMTLRQKAVVAVLAVVALYVGAVMFWFVSAEGTWKRARKDYQKAKETYVKEERLIARKAELEEACEKEQSSMLMFAEEKATDTTWLQKTGEIAAANLVQISSRKAQKESTEEVGDDVRSLPIEASWEASLEALVKFMYALENSDEGLFDFSKLVFRPSQKKGYLKGTFTVTCAYRRGEVEKPEEEPEETEKEEIENDAENAKE